MLVFRGSAVGGKYWYDHCNGKISQSYIGITERQGWWKKQPLRLMQKSDEIGFETIECDLRDSWFHKVCSETHLQMPFQMSEFKAKYLLFRCEPGLEKLVVIETFYALSQKTTEKILPWTDKGSSKELNLSDRSKGVWELIAEVKFLERNRDHPVKPGPDMKNVTSFKLADDSDKVDT